MGDRDSDIRRLNDAALVRRAWEALGHSGVPVGIQDISAKVSTNRVFRLTFERGAEVIAKTSSYGSYVHFRQDHQLIAQWRRLLGGTRFSEFLAPIIGPPGDVFTYREQERWVVFYDKAPFYDFLPRVLTLDQVRAFGRELAHFHLASAAVAPRLDPTWKTLGSDVAALHEVLGSDSFRHEHGLSDQEEHFLRGQCELLLLNAERLGYHHMPRSPVLLDWNIGNFSVGLEATGFKFYSRWDYDWFRIGPRTLDFYFAARVVRSEGDKTLFSYNARPFFEPRFGEFLRAYHEIFPLQEEDLLFLKEAYRFFLLNYVVRSGQHFFRSTYLERLLRECVTRELPTLDSVDFRCLLDVLGSD